jgi:hypothetical protein
MPRSEQGLFQALEQELKQSKEPMDCHMLFERESVRQFAQTVNRVSDYLGGLWRKGKVVRLAAPRVDNSRSRWMYQWKDTRRRHTNDAALHVVAPTPASSKPEAAAVRMARPILQKQRIEITEDGEVVTIELPNATIVIRPKAASVT